MRRGATSFAERIDRPGEKGGDEDANDGGGGADDGVQPLPVGGL